MNRYIVMVLLLAGMGLGAGIVGPAARNLLTDAHAATGELIHFTVQTSQGFVALTGRKLDYFFAQNASQFRVNRIEPNAAGKGFKAYLTAYEELVH